MLCTFPHLTTKEFEQACTDLQHRYNLCGNEKGDWLSVEMVQHFDTTCLEIRKELRIGRCAIDGINNEPEQDHVEEDDEEALQVVAKSQAVIHYDVLLSPVYYVPVLYFSISDPQHRCPPTMATLYEYLIPVEFRAQTESGGVIGGVSVQDHPISNRPVFFIHPCQTAEVMEASVGRKDVTPEEYLIMWIGALGKCVGLNVPLALMQENKHGSEHANKS